MLYGVPMQKTGKYLPGVNFLYFFGLKNYDAWDRSIWIFFFKNDKTWTHTSQNVQNEWFWVICWRFQNCHDEHVSVVLSHFPHFWSQFLTNFDKLYIESNLRTSALRILPLGGWKPKTCLKIADISNFWHYFGYFFALCKPLSVKITSYSESWGPKVGFHVKFVKIGLELASEIRKYEGTQNFDWSPNHSKSLILGSTHTFWSHTRTHLAHTHTHTLDPPTHNCPTHTIGPYTHLAHTHTWPTHTLDPHTHTWHTHTHTWTKYIDTLRPHTHTWTKHIDTLGSHTHKHTLMTHTHLSHIYTLESHMHTWITHTYTHINHTHRPHTHLDHTHILEPYTLGSHTRTWTINTHFYHTMHFENTAHTHTWTTQHTHLDNTEKHLDQTHTDQNGIRKSHIFAPFVTHKKLSYIYYIIVNMLLKDGVYLRNGCSISIKFKLMSCLNKWFLITFSGPLDKYINLLILVCEQYIYMQQRVRMKKYNFQIIFERLIIGKYNIEQTHAYLHYNVEKFTKKWKYF